MAEQTPDALVCDECGAPMTVYDADGQWCDAHQPPAEVATPGLHRFQPPAPEPVTPEPVCPYCGHGSDHGRYCICACTTTLDVLVTRAEAAENRVRALEGLLRDALLLRGPAAVDVPARMAAALGLTMADVARLQEPAKSADQHGAPAQPAEGGQ